MQIAINFQKSNESFQKAKRIIMLESYPGSEIHIECKSLTKHVLAQFHKDIFRIRIFQYKIWNPYCGTIGLKAPRTHILQLVWHSRLKNPVLLHLCSSLQLHFRYDPRPRHSICHNKNKYVSIRIILVVNKKVK